MATVVLANPTLVGGATPQFLYGAFAITPSDADVWNAPVAVRAGGAGTLVVTPWNGGADVTYTLIVGEICPVMVKAVKTASTATGLIGHY